jgi:hypothetical protein
MGHLYHRYVKHAVLTILPRYWHRIVQIAIQPGRQDLFGSIFVTAGLLALFETAPVSAQVGVGATEQLLCGSGSINIAQVVTLGLGLMSAYFIFKFLWRLMTGLDKAGEVRLDRDPAVDRLKKQRYLKLQIRDSSYSLVAALLPVLVPVFLQVAGIDTVSCLFG